MTNDHSYNFWKALQAVQPYWLYGSSQTQPSKLVAFQCWATTCIFTSFAVMLCLWVERKKWKKKSSAQMREWVRTSHFHFFDGSCCTYDVTTLTVRLFFNCRSFITIFSWDSLTFHYFITNMFGRDVHQLWLKQSFPWKNLDGLSLR